MYAVGKADMTLAVEEKLKLLYTYVSGNVSE